MRAIVRTFSSSIESAVMGGNVKRPAEEEAALGTLKTLGQKI
jgi:hypothetical protein